MQSTEKALVLKVGRFRESDCWVRLLSPGRGVFNAFAFGGARSRRRFPGCLDTFNLVLFSLSPARRGEYLNLEEGTLLNGFPGLRESQRRMGLAANCLKFVESLNIDPEDAPVVFELLVEMLELIESGRVEDMAPFLFRAKLVFELGFRPDCVVCSGCGETVCGTEQALFAVERGMVLCAACKTSHKPLQGLARPVSVGALRALDFIQSTPPKSWTGLSLSPEVARQLRQCIDEFVAYHLGYRFDGGVYKKV